MIVPQSTLVHENKKKAKLFKEERDLPIFVDRILRKSFIFPFLGEFAQISALGRGQKSKLAKISSATSFCIPNGTWKPREIFDFRKKSIYSPPLLKIVLNCLKHEVSWINFWFLLNSSTRWFGNLDSPSWSCPPCLFKNLVPPPGGNFPKNRSPPWSQGGEHTM